jgi:hypothetical protein
MTKKALIAMTLVLACTKLNEPALPPTVQFRLDAPFCGSMSIRFLIDGTQVGAGTLSHGMMSPAYQTTAGQHLVRGSFQFGTSQIPRDTTVTLQDSQAFVRVLEFYCS